MKKILFVLSFCLVSSLFSNEQDTKSDAGPFGRLIKNRENVEFFKKDSVALPPDVKIIKQIEISFEDGDGNIKKEIVFIDKMVNPNDDEIVFSSGNVFKAMSFSYTPILEASLITTPKISFGKVEEEKIAIETIENVTLPQESQAIKEKSIKHKLEITHSNKTKNLFLELTQNGLFIKTDDKIKRTMNLLKGNKIVIDFDKQSTIFKTETFIFNKYGFKNTTVGAHKDFYRLSILVDNQYKDFEIKERSGGYLVILK